MFERHHVHTDARAASGPLCATTLPTVMNDSFSPLEIYEDYRFWNKVMNATKPIMVLAVLVIGIARPARSIELQRATITAWQDYLCGAEVRMHQHLDTNKPFLWIDETADRALRVRRGEVVVAPAVGHGTQYVPNGLIHDWIGAIFIPNATLASLFSVLHDYDSYKETYNPTVTDSKLLVGDAIDQQFSMVWQRHVLFVNAAMQGWYHSHDFLVGSGRGYSTVDTTRIQEIQNYRHSDEHLFPPDSGSGFIWRVHSITRYEQRDGGVYLEIEAIALTRDIPPSVRPLVDPIVHRLSINSLVTTLRETRLAVNNQALILTRIKMRAPQDRY